MQFGWAPRYRDSQVWSRVLPQSGRIGGWVGWDRIRTKHSDLLLRVKLKPRNQTQVGWHWVPSRFQTRRQGSSLSSFTHP